MKMSNEQFIILAISLIFQINIDVLTIGFVIPSGEKTSQAVAFLIKSSYIPGLLFTPESRYLSNICWDYIVFGFLVRLPVFPSNISIAILSSSTEQNDIILVSSLTLMSYNVSHFLGLSDTYFLFTDTLQFSIC